MTDLDTLSNAALLPCPFCGSSKVQSGGDDKVVGVWCLNCQASGPNGYLTINGDFDWNVRAGDLSDRAQARNEALEEAATALFGISIPVETTAEANAALNAVEIFASAIRALKENTDE